MGGSMGRREEPDATLWVRRGERQTRMDREVRDVDVRLARLGDGQIMAAEGEEGGVRADSVSESRWLGRWQYHSLRLGTCRSGQGRC